MISRSAAYEWRDDDVGFMAAWDRAVEAGTDRLEDELLRRAKDGTLRPVFYEGVECGKIREYSDTLGIFLLKGRRPEKYRERASLELSGQGGGPISIADSRADNAALVAAARRRLAGGSAGEPAGSGGDGDPGEAPAG